jgi:hypothetical protein
MNKSGIPMIESVAGELGLNSLILADEKLECER